MTVRSPKTAAHDGRAVRIVPITPELRPILQALFDQAPEGSDAVVPRLTDPPTNLRTPVSPAQLPLNLSSLLRLHRAAVLNVLLAGRAPENGTEPAAILSERLGIADDLALPTHPGTPAWLIAVGESILTGGLTS